MAISIAGVYIKGTADGSGGGTRSVTDVTIPTHDIAIVTISTWSTTLPSVDTIVLNGVTGVLIDEHVSTTETSITSYLVVGAAAGSNKTLSWHANNAYSNGPVINILFLSGVLLASPLAPIRSHATDYDAGGDSGVSGLSYNAGDVVVLFYVGDSGSTLGATGGGANAIAISQTDEDGLIFGAAYKTSTGTIAISNGANTVVVGMVVKVGSAPTVTTLKMLVHASAASATNVQGVVFQAPTGGEMTGAKIGEFSGESFEASLESGQAVLKVICSAFGGGALTTANTPVAIVRNATNTSGVVPCTIIEE